MLSVKYTKAIEKALKPALGSAKKRIERELGSGKSRLYKVSSAPLYLVIRFEESEMVVVAVAGRKLRDGIGEIVEFARSNGAQSIRFHTKGLARKRVLMALNGWPIYLSEKKASLFASEYVYKMRL